MLINFFFLGILYQAPEQLKNREQNRRRNVDQNWVKQTQNRRQSGDIYSFGMVMYEILFRALPFPDNANIEGLNSFRLLTFVIRNFYFSSIRQS